MLKLLLKTNKETQIEKKDALVLNEGAVTIAQASLQSKGYSINHISFVFNIFIALIVLLTFKSNYRILEQLSSNQISASQMHENIAYQKSQILKMESNLLGFENEKKTSQRSTNLRISALNEKEKIIENNLKNLSKDQRLTKDTAMNLKLSNQLLVTKLTSVNQELKALSQTYDEQQGSLEQLHKRLTRLSESKEELE